MLIPHLTYIYWPSVPSRPVALGVAAALCPGCDATAAAGKTGVPPEPWPAAAAAATAVAA